ncbi:MAG: nitroreductase family protein [Lentisphaeria bacterium]|jgi:rfaE bifunctional protein nucleotidyltransferase chain/domain
MITPERKIMTLDQAIAWHAALRNEHKTLAVTNGAFDLLHRGHVEYLNQTAKEADALLVAVNSDASVRQLKGPERPLINENDRAMLLASLQAVDAVVIFNGPKPLDVFSAIHPDVYVKGGDYTEDSLDREEYALLKSVGARFVFIPFVAGFSTTSIFRRLRDGGSAPTAGQSSCKAVLNNALDMIFCRRSVRRYQPRPVADEQIDAILQAAMAAPSACAKDPWQFHVLKNDGLRADIAATLPYGHFLAQAPTGIVVCGDLRRAHGGELSYLIQDCSAACENILLAVSQLGLGACWLGVHPRQDRVDAIRRLLKQSAEIIPVAAIAIGWPAENPPKRSRYRDDAVYWER